MFLVPVLCTRWRGGGLGHVMMMHAGITGGFQDLPGSRQFSVSVGEN